MRWLFTTLLVVHGTIHFLGVARALDLAELPGLTQPISRPMGVGWLLAGLGMLGTGALLILGTRVWWMVGLAALILSQSAIIASWGDARYGTIANVLVLAGVVYGFASQGPFSLGSQYRRAVSEHMGAAGTASVVTEADLERLPEPVRQYLRVTGALGRPRPGHFKVEWRGRIRATADDPWMEFTAEQHSFLEAPAQLFMMNARRGGLPVDVYHAYRDESASMEVRLLSLVPITRLDGPDLTRAETVTLLNDLALLAPGGLLDPAIEWESAGPRSARARYTVGSNTISAELVFDGEGRLVDFVSQDRMKATPDGGDLEPMRWSTPVGDYRRFGALYVMSRGEGLWHEAEGSFSYLELELVGLEEDGVGR